MQKGRTKERLFEEEMEVVWEKGGSGLVFYTDASHWHNLEGGMYNTLPNFSGGVDLWVYYVLLQISMSSVRRRMTGM